MKKLYLTISVMLMVCFYVEAAPCGKISGGPTAMKVNVLQSGKTTQKMDMYGGRVDLTVAPFDGSGLCLKPFFLGATGDGDLYSGGIALGHYTPIADTVCLLPSIGYSHSSLSTKIDLAPTITNVEECFKSDSVYLGLDFVWKPHCDWCFTFMYQYAWADTKTTFKGFKQFNTKGESQGSNFALMADYFFTENWSVNAAVGYNKSLSKEKHGLEAKGVMLGLSRCF